jgi:MFS family permease
MGQGVIWYTGQFYAQSFLENTCKIEFNESRYILLWAIALATPFFIVFGSLSDRFGRKWIMLGGMFLAVIFYRPIYQNFLDNSNITSLSTSTSILNSIKVNSENPMSNTENIRLSNGYSFTKMTETVSSEISPVIKYSNIRLPSKTFTWFVFLVFVQILFVTMVYGPIAAFLVDLFPTKIRYTSMSLPYHIGNGVFGGLVPFLATLITSFKGTDALSGLWYPIAVASVCFIIGLIYLDNKKTDLTLLGN